MTARFFNDHPLWAVVALAAIAALLIVALSNAIGIGVIVFPIIAAGAAQLVLGRVGLTIATAISSGC